MISAARTPSAWISAEYLGDVLRRCATGLDHQLKRFGVVDHRAERLAELMRNRAGQRRHGDPATGIGGERQILSTLDFGAQPCAALEQQPDDQQCLNRNRSGADHDHGPVFAPETGTLMAHFAARRQPALVDVPALQLAPVEYRLTWQLRRDADAARGRSIQDTNRPSSPCCWRGRRWTSGGHRQFRYQRTGYECKQRRIRSA